MDKEPITLNGLEKLKKNGLLKIKRLSILKEVDTQNLIYYLIEGQNLVYKQVEMLKVF